MWGFHVCRTSRFSNLFATAAEGPDSVSSNLVIGHCVRSTIPLTISRRSSSRSLYGSIVATHFSICLACSAWAGSFFRGLDRRQQRRQIAQVVGTLAAAFPLQCAHDAVARRIGHDMIAIPFGVVERVYLQSTTDQVHYLRMPSITTGSLTAGVPEQLLQWLYPVQDSDPENVAFCIMFGMLSRFDLAGQIDKLDKRGTQLVHEGIAVYKTYRRDIPRMIPFFPVGTSLIHDSERFVVAGLKKEHHALAYIIVYRLDGKRREIEISLEGFAMKRVRAAILYPSQRPCSVRKSRRGITVTLPRKRTARLIHVQRMNAPR